MMCFKRATHLILLLFLSVSLVISCSDDSTSPEEATELTVEEAEERFLEFLKETGYFSSSFFDDSSSKSSKNNLPPVPEDYIDSKLTESDNIQLNLWVDEAGNIVPNTKWYEENPDYCMAQNRYLKAPVTLVQVELHPEVQTVFVRVIEIETSEVQQMQEGQGDGDFWVDEAIEEAWNKLEDVNIEQADDPCSGQIEMEMIFDSWLKTAKSGDEYMISRVRAEIELKYSEETESFKGSAPLVHQEYTIWAEEELSCSYDLEDGVQEVEIRFPEPGVKYSPDIVGLLGPRTSDEAPTASWICTDGETKMEGIGNIWWSSFVLIHEDKGSEDGFVFTDWQEVDDPWTTAELTFDRTEQIKYDESGDYTITEETKIQIRHANDEEE